VSSRGGPPSKSSAPAGFPEGLLAARHVDPPRTGRQPLYAYQLSAGHWFSTADTALVLTILSVGGQDSTAVAVLTAVAMLMASVGVTLISAPATKRGPVCL